MAAARRPARRDELRAWLAERGLGLVPVADAATFSWAGPWIALRPARDGSGPRARRHVRRAVGRDLGPRGHAEEILEGSIVARWTSRRGRRARGRRGRRRPRRGAGHRAGRRGAGRPRRRGARHRGPGPAGRPLRRRSRDLRLRPAGQRADARRRRGPRQLDRAEPSTTAATSSSAAPTSTRSSAASSRSARCAAAAAACASRARTSTASTAAASCARSCTAADCAQTSSAAARSASATGSRRPDGPCASGAAAMVTELVALSGEAARRWRPPRRWRVRTAWPATRRSCLRRAATRWCI